MEISPARSRCISLRAILRRSKTSWTFRGTVDGKTIKGNWSFVGGPSEDFCNDFGTFKMIMI